MQKDFSQAVQALCDNTKEHFGSHSYAAGFLNMTLQSVFAQLNKAQQQDLLDTMHKGAAAYAKQKEAV